MEFRSIYMTFANPEQARKIAAVLVSERLVACTNMLGAIESQYWWDGKIVTDSETAVIAKTRDDLVDAVIDRVKALHSYTVPCVVALPIVAGNPDYLGWLASETRTPMP